MDGWMDGRAGRQAGRQAGIDRYSLVCVRPGRKPECWFFHNEAHFVLKKGLK